MTIQEVMSDIKSAKFKPLYVFAGEELDLMHVYTHKIADTVGAKLEVVDSVADIFQSLSVRGMFDSRHCYLIFDDKDFLEAEKDWEKLIDRTDDNVVILVLTKLDKRGKFYKSYGDIVVAFERMSADILAKYVAKKVDLKPKQIQELCDICECRYGRIMLEVDKILAYSEEKSLNHSVAYKKLMDDGLIYAPPRDVIFDFANAVCARNPVASYGYLQELTELGESPLIEISVIYNGLKQMLQVQSCDNDDIEGTTGLSIGQIRATQRKIGHYKIGELVMYLKLIKRVETAIKNGRMDQDNAVEYILSVIL